MKKLTESQLLAVDKNAKLWKNRIYFDTDFCCKILGLHIHRSNCGSFQHAIWHGMEISNDEAMTRIKRIGQFWYDPSSGEFQSTGFHKERLVEFVMARIKGYETGFTGMRSQVFFNPMGPRGEKLSVEKKCEAVEFPNSAFLALPGDEFPHGGCFSSLHAFEVHCEVIVTSVVNPVSFTIGIDQLRNGDGWDPDGNFAEMLTGFSSQEGSWLKGVYFWGTSVRSGVVLTKKLTKFFPSGTFRPEECLKTNRCKATDDRIQIRHPNVGYFNLKPLPRVEDAVSFLKEAERLFNLTTIPLRTDFEALREDFD
jgi:hypothetical protein